jgi:hypothetical protein
LHARVCTLHLRSTCASSRSFTSRRLHDALQSSVVQASAGQIAPAETQDGGEARHHVPPTIADRENPTSINAGPEVPTSARCRTANLTQCAITADVIGDEQHVGNEQHMPPSFHIQTVASAPPEPSDAGGDDGAEWEAYQDDEYKRTYYHNRGTGQTQWTMPARFTPTHMPKADERTTSSVGFGGDASLMFAGRNGKPLEEDTRLLDAIQHSSVAPPNPRGDLQQHNTPATTGSDRALESESGAVPRSGIRQPAQGSAEHGPGSEEQLRESAVAGGGVVSASGDGGEQPSSSSRIAELKRSLTAAANLAPSAVPSRAQLQRSFRATSELHQQSTNPINAQLQAEASGVQPVAVASDALPSAAPAAAVEPASGRIAELKRSLAANVPALTAGPSRAQSQQSFPSTSRSLQPSANPVVNAQPQAEADGVQPAAVGTDFSHASPSAAPAAAVEPSSSRFAELKSLTANVLTPDLSRPQSQRIFGRLPLRDETQTLAASVASHPDNEVKECSVCGEIAAGSSGMCIGDCTFWTCKDCFDRHIQALVDSGKSNHLTCVMRCHPITYRILNTMHKKAWLSKQTFDRINTIRSEFALLGATRENAGTRERAHTDMSARSQTRARAIAREHADARARRCLHAFTGTHACAHAQAFRKTVGARRQFSVCIARRCFYLTMANRSSCAIRAPAKASSFAPKATGG